MTSGQWTIGALIKTNVCFPSDKVSFSLTLITFFKQIPGLKLLNITWIFAFKTIVTSGYSPNLKAKEIWVNENLPYCQFIGVNLKEYSDKSHIDMGKNSIFIDDSSHNLTTSSAEYKVCFGDIYDWNKDWDGKRCYNWSDVRDYICKIKY